MNAARVEICQFIRLEHVAAFEADGWTVARMPHGDHHFANHGTLIASRRVRPGWLHRVLHRFGRRC